jgi:hypothetical protein
VTTFEDGPAMAKTLCLRRSPRLLRVVISSAGEVDALDQLDDVPAMDEAIVVYRLVEDRGWIHINSRDRKTNRYTGGTFAMACYRLHSVQPPTSVLRSTSDWRIWAQVEADKIETQERSDP